MRSKLMLRVSRPVYLGAAALMLAVPATAAALAAGQADARSAIQITLAPQRATFGHPVTVRGNATAVEARKVLQLQFKPAGSATWRALVRTTVRGDGSFRFAARAVRSGLLRVVPASAVAVPRSPAEVPAASADPNAAVSASRAQALAVAARFNLSPRAIAVLAGQRGHVRGRLLPAVAGRTVRLATRGGGGWRTLVTARTGARGGFDLKLPSSVEGRRWLRVGFAGDRANGRASAPAGNVTTFSQSGASWYDDGGATACGFHAFYGVANKSLPCGTRVTFRYGGRSVTAV
ncbi:MAG: RlpA-like double-psi beta-barrel domain-containing protein, partial [Actinomycetota bacterium]|nr:RlpA-like double-psi beta-barrel domain-containing protein [Actinomycetota bacterium]